MTLSYSVAETAAILRVSAPTIRRAIRAGEIPQLNAGPRMRVPALWIEQQHPADPARKATGRRGTEREKA